MRQNKAWRWRDVQRIQEETIRRLDILTTVPITLSHFHDPRENTPEQEARRQSDLERDK